MRSSRLQRPGQRRDEALLAVVEDAGEETGNDNKQQGSSDTMATAAWPKHDRDRGKKAARLASRLRLQSKRGATTRGRMAATTSGNCEKDVVAKAIAIEEKGEMAATGGSGQRKVAGVNTAVQGNAAVEGGSGDTVVREWATATRSSNCSGRWQGWPTVMKRGGTAMAEAARLTGKG
ncbi:hypothetical protein B296_00011759 [Ensete ventricosum]|uniref:Uncharacterized protein n=1 Tax=Ensete ventricosum TaxID=4639 RepID=A0A427ANU6_ENSVE|nr:hypothetical protein B296_00011759 [Ensete ventricosum]